MSLTHAGSRGQRCWRERAETSHALYPDAVQACQRCTIPVCSREPGGNTVCAVSPFRSDDLHMDKHRADNTDSGHAQIWHLHAIFHCNRRDPSSENCRQAELGIAECGENSRAIQQGIVLLGLWMGQGVVLLRTKDVLLRLQQGPLASQRCG